MATFTIPVPSTATSGQLDSSQLSGIVSSVLNLQGQAAQNDANAKAQQIIAQGDQQEQAAYGTAGNIAQQNAGIAELSGQLQQTQEQRNIFKTLGQQRAEVAGAGFGNSGSALYLARDSMQQGYLQQQITAEQSHLTAGGFLEQQAAANAEATAAAASGSAAQALAASETQSAALARANAAAESGALSAITGTATGTTPNAAMFDPRTGNPVAPSPQTVAATAASSIAKTVAAGGTPSSADLAALATGNNTANNDAGSLAHVDPRTGNPLPAGVAAPTIYGFPIGLTG